MFALPCFQLTGASKICTAKVRIPLALRCLLPFFFEAEERSRYTELASSFITQSHRKLWTGNMKSLTATGSSGYHTRWYKPVRHRNVLLERSMCVHAHTVWALAPVSSITL